MLNDSKLPELLWPVKKVTKEELLQLYPNKETCSVEGCINPVKYIGTYKIQGGLYGNRLETICKKTFNFCEVCARKIAENE